MAIKVQLTFETEKAIRQAFDSITMSNHATLLLELWDRGLISDDIFASQMAHKTGLIINPYNKET